MSIWASRLLTVSSATPTTMMTDVPPIARLLFLITIPTMIGRIATIARYRAPKSVILLITFRMKSEVGLPGRKPGMKPPFYLRLLAISMGLNWIVA